jgi:hypothetical protein
MIDCDMHPCWRGNIDISQLAETFDGEGANTLAKFDVPNGLLEGRNLSVFSLTERRLFHSDQPTRPSSSLSSRHYSCSCGRSRSNRGASMDVCRLNMESVQSNLLIFSC